MSKPDFIRTPDSGNTIVDVNLKVPGTLGVPNGTIFNINDLQPNSVYLFVKTGAPTDVALQIYFNGNVYQLNQIGPKGDKGDTGARGADGAKGDKGDTGAPGADGAKGEKGDTGAPGTQGSPGAENATLQSVTNNGTGSNITTAEITAVAFNQSSLRELKENIEPYAADALGLLCAMDVRSFNFIGSNENTIGFIVDEVERCNPGILTENRRAIKTNNLLAQAILAIQELQKQVKELQDA